MQKYRFSVSFLLASLLYVAVGFLLFYYANVHIGTQQKPKEKIITLSMSEFVSAPLLPVEEKEAPKEEEPEVVEPEPEPMKEEIKQEVPIIKEVIPEPIVQKVIPKPVVKKIVKRKSVKKKKVKKRIKKKVKKTVHSKGVAKKTQKKSRKSKRKLSRSKASLAKKNRYLSQIRAKINRSKSYPRIAQRRGMQGKVKVRFTILSNGHVSNIQVTGKKVFFKSARQAVKKAFPISTKNIPISLPLTVNFTLKYHLK